MHPGALLILMILNEINIVTKKGLVVMWNAFKN
jgi:hypothetical protein